MLRSFLRVFEGFQIKQVTYSQHCVHIMYSLLPAQSYDYLEQSFKKRLAGQRRNLLEGMDFSCGGFGDEIRGQKILNI
jgi:hypothetical protein